MRSSRLAALVLGVLAALVACSDDGGTPADEDARDRRDAGADVSTVDIAPADVESDVTLDLGLPDATDAGASDAASDVADGSGEADVEEDAGMSFTQTVGPEGARVSWESVELSFAPGVVDSPTEIRISIVDDIALPDNVMPLTAIYRFEPEGLEFPRGVGLTFRLSSDERDAIAFWTDPGTTTFGGLVTSYLENAVISSTIFHFSHGFGGVYDDSTCDGAPVNVCGGCSTLDGAPNDPCGNGGRLQCADGGETLVCADEAVCGDGDVGGAEACDGEDLGGLSCADFPEYNGGTLACNGDCSFDFAACTAPDPCEFVTCTSAPSATCDGNDIVTYSAPGTCVAGTCEFPEASRTACGELTCSGGVCSSAPREGDIAINEFLADGAGSPDGDFEWVELYNTTPRSFDLNGFTLRDDDADTHRISRSLTLPPNGYVVLAGSTRAAPGEVDYVWESFTLANSEDEIVLEDVDGLPLATIRYNGGWPTSAGVSAQLGLENLGGAVNVSGSWCEPSAAFGEGLGTPGAENERCDGVVDPCDLVTCDTPPERSCDGDTALIYSALGACDAGVCSYDPTRTDCSARGGCLNGRCADAPCEGVVCPARPAACEGDTLIEFAAGVCVEGTCEYAETPTDCTASDRICVSGACQAPIFSPEPGDLVITEFLANAFEGDTDNEWIEVYNPTNFVLELGGCRLYDDGSNSVTFPAGVQLAPRSYGVLAEAGSAVPGSANVLIRWNDLSGSFTLGNDGDEIFLDAPDGRRIDEVEYGGSWGSTEGASAQLSANFLSREANDDPGNFCLSESVYDAAGNRGTPGAANVLCDLPDPCDGVECLSPPSATCEGDVRLSFSSPGACDAGTCEYTEERLDCTLGGDRCVDGACVAPDPCESVTCDTPPAPTCEGDDRISYAATGSCAGGVCTYAPTSFDCTEDGEVCSEGECVDPAELCEGVVCETPPDARCEGDVARSFAAAGTCEAGECSYAPLDEDCALAGEFCVDGECLTSEEACAAVTCDAPPAAACQGSDAVTFEAIGTCAGGACDYAEASRIDCADTGDVCDAGACIPAPDPCEGIVCESPPSDFCDEDDAVQFDPIGACVEGVCMYAQSTTTCEAPDQACEAGACVEVPTGPRAPLEGELVITEFMANVDGNDDGEEWFELYNPTPDDLSLDGGVMSDAGSNAIALPDGLVVPAGSFVVLAETASAVPVAVLYAWNPSGMPNDDFTLGNDDDELILTVGGVEIDRVEYDFGIASDFAKQLDPAFYNGDNSSTETNWCNAREEDAYDGVNYGTPGVTNPGC